MWTFGRRIAAGFALALTLMVIMGLLAHRGIESLTRTSYQVTHTHTVLERIAQLRAMVTEAESAKRGYLLTVDGSYLAAYQAAAQSLPGKLQELRQLTVDNPSQQTRLASLQPLIQARMAEISQVIDLRRKEGLESAIRRIEAGLGKKLMDDIRGVTADMEQEERGLLKRRAAEVEEAARSAGDAILWGTLVCAVFVIAAGFALVRALSRQVSSAVQHVQQSSAELQAAATQQSASAKESSTAMTEITTTMNELLVTSRQIAESARRVAQVAEQTASAAHNGEGALQRGSDAISGIRDQVDSVVSHMLDLGKKSQQIGAVLDIVSELAEQTNILAINATIEASGAGEAGRRFGVVADEIRKLADRVTGSAKEIRQLIEDMRGAVNTTVMATETSAKTVEAGYKLFADVTVSFNDIARMIGTTTEATREIELSTKQQTTAVEQVNTAISGTAQATRETEASSSQTFQTATELVKLSKNLLKFVKPQAVA